MERVMIQIPDNKSDLVKSLLKELGVVIEPDLIKMARNLNKMVLPREDISMDEIVEEVRAVRAKS